MITLALIPMISVMFYVLVAILTLSIYVTVRFNPFLAEFIIAILVVGALLVGEFANVP